jgi:hypothetical protein
MAVFIAVAASTVAPAVGAAVCSQETVTVESAPVTIGYCINGAPRANGAEEVVVPVIATYSAPAGTVRRATELHFIAGEGVSRVIESLDLSKLGLTGTLHLTLAYSHGLVRLEGALLTPGAITIK